MIHYLLLLVGLALSAFGEDDPSLSPDISPASQSADQTQQKNPFTAGVLSSVWAGGGQIYLGQTTRGALYSLDNAALLGFKFDRVRTPEERTIRSSTSIVAYNFFYHYQAYEAYATALRDWDQETVFHRDTYSLRQMFESPLRADSYSKKVWIPLLLPSALLVSRLGNIHPRANLGRSLYQIPAAFAAAMLIGVGEEAMFRGFQQPLFSQWTGSRGWGNFLQSVSFGSCHTNWGICDAPFLTGHVATLFADDYHDRTRSYTPGDAGQATKFIFTSAVGYYLGHIHENDPNGLQKAITLHFLWDALIFSADYLKYGSSVPIYLSVGGNF